MVKKHCRDEKGIGPKLYPDKYALLSCTSKTVMHAVITHSKLPKEHQHIQVISSYHTYTSGAGISLAILPLSKQLDFLL